MYRQLTFSVDDYPEDNMKNSIKMNKKISSLVEQTNIEKYRMYSH